MINFYQYNNLNLISSNLLLIMSKFMCPTHPWNVAMQYNGVIAPCCAKGHKCKEIYIRQLMYTKQQNLKTKQTKQTDEDIWDEDYDSPLFSKGWGKKETKQKTTEEEWNNWKKKWVK